MAQLLFNKRFLKVIVALTHLLILFLLVMFVASLDSTTLDRVQAIRAVQNNYDNVGLGYIGHARDIAHGVAFVCGLIVGCRMIVYGMSRSHEVTQFYGVAIGVQILMAAVLNLVLVGLVWFGGIWHLLTLFVAVLEAASLVVTSSLMMLYWGSLVNLAEKQDKMVAEAYGTTDEALHREPKSQGSLPLHG